MGRNKPSLVRQGNAVFSILSLGFLIGIRHAFEADHVAAVASLATKRLSIRQTIKQGAVWGLGHTLALFLFGGIVLFMNVLVPEELARWLELAVGVMLVLLGADVLRRMIRDRIHFHAHSHNGGIRHFHAHSHKGQQFSGSHPEKHSHQHADRFPLRALFIGLMHGMAGSAALIILTLNTITMPIWGLVYIAVFGIGSILGMATISFILAFPLRKARSFTLVHNGIQGVIGGMTIALGIFTVFSVGVL